MEEVRVTANADLSEDKLPPLTSSDMEHMWHLTDNMGAYEPSTLIDFRQGRELEIDYMFTEVQSRALSHSIPTKELDSLISRLHERREPVQLTDPKETSEE